MIYEDFITFLTNGLQLALGPDMQIRRMQVPKNNGHFPDALCLLRPGEQASPAIYLKEYWERCQAGTSTEQILKEILQFYQDQCGHPGYDLSCFDSFEAVKPFLTCKLIHGGQNEALLPLLPHQRILDLAVVFCILFQAPALPAASALIRYEHLEAWGISVNELQETAFQNVVSLLPPVITPIDELIGQILHEEMAQFGAEDSTVQDLLFRDVHRDFSRTPMFVLTNTQKYLGAACLLYPGLLREVSRQCGSSFYILPSSIHELILVPKQTGISSIQLAEMVSDINQSSVDPTERLSNEIYLYQADQDSLVFANPPKVDQL